MREVIQAKLDETSIECGNLKSDDILEKGQTYFGYQLTNNYRNSDMENTYEMAANINGYLSRLEDSTENTLEIVDNAVQEIVNKLKELDFRTTYEDVSIENGIRKIHITGRAVAQDNELLGGRKDG